MADIKDQFPQDAPEYAANIVDTIREPLLILDADLKVISANRSFYKMFNAVPEETEGQRIFNLGNGQWNIPRLREFLEKILPQHASFDDFEVEHEFPDIGKRIMLLNAREIYIKKKKSKLILIAIEDITKLKHLEKMKDLLSQMIIHDLINPLAAISLYVQDLEMSMQSSLSEDQKKDIYLALYKIREMSNMISSLLDISKMEEGKLDLRYKTIFLGDILKETVEDVKILARCDEKIISISAPPDLPAVPADKDMLKRIVFNLVGNALKFSPAGSAIEIAAHYDKDAKEIVVSVKDEGEGIPKEYLQRVFEKFTQVESPGGEKRAGKGLGLTFCKMAVEAHGGIIRAESEVGIGSTFYFTLPTEAKIKNRDSLGRETGFGQ